MTTIWILDFTWYYLGEVSINQQSNFIKNDRWHTFICNHNCMTCFRHGFLKCSSIKSFWEVWYYFQYIQHNVKNEIIVCLSTYKARWYSCQVKIPSFSSIELNALYHRVPSSLECQLHLIAFSTFFSNVIDM